LKHWRQSQSIKHLDQNTALKSVAFQNQDAKVSHAYQPLCKSEDADSDLQVSGNKKEMPCWHVGNFRLKTFTQVQLSRTHLPRHQPYEVESRINICQADTLRDGGKMRVEKLSGPLGIVVQSAQRL